MTNSKPEPTPEDEAADRWLDTDLGQRLIKSTAGADARAKLRRAVEKGYLIYGIPERFR